MYRERRRGESPDADAGRLIAELETGFELLRLKRYMADLEQRDARLVEEIEILKACLHPPTSWSATSWLRRVLVSGGKIFWLKTRRAILAEEWRRCSAMENDIRFGLLVTGVRSPQG